MKTLSFRLSGLAITLAIAGLALAQTGGDVTTLTSISGYRQWTKVNADPVKVEIPLKVDPGSVASWAAVDFSAVRANPTVNSVTVPPRKVVDGLSNIATTGANTTIRYPRPGETTPAPTRSSQPKDGHLTSLGFSYVNEAGRDAFRKQASSFPVGSIIVRERLLTPTSNPDRLVVMIKHDREFNPQGDGWEFVTISGDATKVIKREKEGSCLICHAAAGNNDFVFPLNQK